MKLADFLTQIAGAAQVAGREARKTAQRSLEDALEPHPDNDGEYRLRRIMVRMPGPTLDRDEGHLLAIPHYALLTGGNADLEYVRAEVEAEIDPDSLAGGPEGALDDAAVANVLGLEMRRGLFRKSANVKIEMQFKIGDSPEIAEAMRDRLARLLHETLKQEPDNGR